MSNDPTYKPSAEPIGEPTYRVFRLQPDGGIHSAEVIDAKDDDEAREIARTMVTGHGIDLWERAGFLESYPSLEAWVGKRPSSPSRLYRAVRLP